MLDGTCHCGRCAWRLAELPSVATACNCSICRRYGALWGYGYLGEDLELHGEAGSYRRTDSGDIDFRFCRACGCVVAWIGLTLRPDGRTRAAVNLRLAEFERISDLPIRHFDGRDTFRALSPDGRCIRDVWF